MKHKSGKGSDEGRLLLQFSVCSCNRILSRMKSTQRAILLNKADPNCFIINTKFNAEILSLTPFLPPFSFLPSPSPAALAAHTSITPMQDLPWLPPCWGWHLQHSSWAPRASGGLPEALSCPCGRPRPPSPATPTTPTSRPPLWHGHLSPCCPSPSSLPAPPGRPPPCPPARTSLACRPHRSPGIWQFWQWDFIRTCQVTDGHLVPTWHVRGPGAGFCDGSSWQQRAAQGS